MMFGCVDDSSSPEGRILSRERREHYASFWQSDLFTDCVVAVGTHEIKVHRFVVATYGTVFKRMLQSGLQETNMCRIEITDYSYEGVYNMLEYMYTGVFTQPMDDVALDLLKIADKYFLSALKSKCAKALGKKLSLNNAIDTLIIADKYNSEYLTTASLEFIKSNYQAIRNSEKWNGLEKENVHLVSKIADFNYSPGFLLNKKAKTTDKNFVSFPTFSFATSPNIR